jgi:hypothetical protein
VDQFDREVDLSSEICIFDGFDQIIYQIPTLYLYFESFKLLGSFHISVYLLKFEVVYRLFHYFVDIFYQFVSELITILYIICYILRGYR